MYEMESELIRVKKILSGIPEERRLCCNPEWYRAYIREIHLKDEISRILNYTPRY